MFDLPMRGIFAFLIFVSNSTFSILYFSTLIGYSSKFTLFKDAFKIALPGTFLISVLIFFDPWLPRFYTFGPLSSLTDIGIISSIILWTVLTRHYCETGWLSSIIVSFVAFTMNTLIMVFIYGFLLLTV